MGVPHEIIAAPFDVYLGPVGETMPAIDAVPGGNWVKLGTSGKKSYSEDGVTVEHSQEIEQVFTLGRTGPVKAFRTKEGLRIKVTVLDLTLERYRRLLNDVSITTTAAGSGTAGHKAIPLTRGLDVQTLALLVRGDVSPDGASWKSQYEVPTVYVDGSPEVVLKKGEPAGLAFEFVALEDTSASSGQEFGNLRVQHADPA